jgi:hypothetical protein
MKKPISHLKPGPGRYKVGDRVRILYGLRGAVGEVIEDRGKLGVGGERIYVVRIQVDPWNEITPEYPESSLETVSE